MKNIIIRINDVSDIDTSRISVYDMNNRYIDPYGNLYGLKYNLGSKKVDVIRLVRAHDKLASDMEYEINRKKMTSFDELNEEEEYIEKEEEPPEVVTGETVDSSMFDPEEYINNSIELMKTHRGRIAGIIMNIRNSNIVSQDNKAESSELDDIFRTIEIDGLQGFEDTENYQKELINYPRSITYYQSKIDTRGRKIVETLAAHKDRVMKFIYYYEMYHMIHDLYLKIIKMMNRLQEFLRDKNPDNMRNISPHDKQSFRDAELSIKNTVSEIEKILDESKLFEEYLYNADNF